MSDLMHPHPTVPCLSWEHPRPSWEMESEDMVLVGHRQGEMNPSRVPLCPSSRERELPFPANPGSGAWGK